MYRENLTDDERLLLLTPAEDATSHAPTVCPENSAEADRALAALHEDFATSIQSCCIRLTRREVGVRLCSAGRGSFGQFILCQANPTCCLSIASTCLESEYFLAIQPCILFPLMDHMLGATETEPVPDRPLSEIESRVAVCLAEALIQGYQQTWQPVLALESSVERIYQHAQQIAVMHGMQEVYLARYEISCGSARGWLELSLPWHATRQMRARLDANYSPTARSGLAALTADRSGLAKPPPI